MDFGTQNKPMGEPVGLDSGDGGEAKVDYPGFYLRDAVADDFRAQFPDVKVGDTVSMTISAKVSGITQDKYSNSVQLDVMSGDNITTQGDMQGTGAPDPSAEHEAAETPEEEAEEHASGQEAQDENDSGDGTMTDAGEEKALGYKRPKKAKKFDVDTSAKSFLD